MIALRLGRTSPRNARDDHRGVAAMEFAIVAPIMLLMIWGVYDVTRALLAWEETFHAAEAIAQAAEKLSYSTRTYDNSTKPVTALTAQQMQDAMSTIYAEMPWLNLGNPGGLLPGSYQVTLSGVSYNHTCVPMQALPCTLQLPIVLWSSYLTEGGANLVNPPPNLPADPYRPCNVFLNRVPQFPNNAQQLQDMIDPNLVPNGVQNIILIPQVVADVVYTFTPSFPLLSGLTYTFYASATFPAPVGGDDQAIVFDEENYNGNSVEVCNNGNNGSPYNG